MTRLDHLAETTKIARLLGVEVARMRYLDRLAVADLRALRERVSNALYDDTRPTLARVAAGSKLLPSGTVARIGERGFGAMLCARIAGLLPPARALEVALKMPDEFLAAVSAQLDPRRAAALLAGMPAERVVAVAAILVERGDFITAGRFVEYLAANTIQAVIASITDETVLLHIAFFIESKATLDQLVGFLPPARLSTLVARATGDRAQLWPEALALMSHVDDAWKRAIGDLAADQDEGVLRQMLATTLDRELWPALLPIVACMSPDRQRRLLGLPAVGEPPVLAAIVAAADDSGLWPRLLPLVQVMDDRVRVALAAVVATLDAAALERIVVAALAEPSTWPGLRAIAAVSPDAVQRELAELVGRLGRDTGLVLAPPPA